MPGGLFAALAGSTWARTVLRYGVTALAFLLARRRPGECAGRLAEKLDSSKQTHAVQRRMLEAAARRPHARDDLAEWRRDAWF